MSTRYVVSIAGGLLYFDADRKPVAAFAHEAPEGEKPALKLVPPKEQPASGADWDEALSAYSTEQRASAEISDVIDDR